MAIGLGLSAVGCSTEAEVPPSPEKAQTCVEALPIELKVGQLLMPAVYGSTIKADTDVLNKYHVGGAIVMTSPRNPKDGSIQRLTKAPEGIRLVATDEEGGLVQRFKNLGALPSARTVARTMTPAEATRKVAEHGKRLNDVGINVVFAPVADVNPVKGDGVLGRRVFSANPKTVSTYAKAYADGWNRAGILPVYKHWPGHGAASGDTHKGFATTPSWATLQKRDLIPYRGAQQTSAGVMVGHLNVPGLTKGGYPASLSPEAVAALRAMPSYANRPVFSDSIHMEAVQRLGLNSGELAAQFIRAGGDVVVDAPLTSRSTQQLERQVRSMMREMIAESTEDPVLTKNINTSVTRLLALRGINPCAVKH